MEEVPQSVLSWVALGVLAGLLVYLWSPRRLPGGLFADIGIGVVGAALGGFLVSYLTGTDVVRAPVTYGSVLVTLFGAIVVLVAAQTEGVRRRDLKK